MGGGDLEEINDGGVADRRGFGIFGGENGVYQD
jgi:hypothetical protein